MIGAPTHIKNLRETIIRMLNNTFSDRPSCDQLLFTINNLTITKEEVLSECGQVLHSLKETANEFFVKLLEIKLSLHTTNA